MKEPIYRVRIMVNVDVSGKFQRVLSQSHVNRRLGFPPPGFPRLNYLANQGGKDVSSVESTSEFTRTSRLSEWLAVPPISYSIAAVFFLSSCTAISYYSPWK